VIEHLRIELDVHQYRDGFKLVGTGESFMEAELRDFYGRHPLVSIAPYAGIGEIKYVFTSSDKNALKLCMDEFYARFSDYIYGSLEDTLEGVVVDLLRKRGYLISTAESCTGGWLSSTLVNVAGSSDVFHEGLVVYHNEAKMRYLDVPAPLLATEGAVSEACVRIMSENLYQKTDADVTIAISGIAGPTGGTPDKPVGLVHFGLHHDGKTIHASQIFNGDRNMVRQRAVIFALNLLRKELLLHESNPGT
jgi:nicotinamide-nucleotide amidase